jgi:hypothetical protein
VQFVLPPILGKYTKVVRACFYSMNQRFLKERSYDYNKRRDSSVSIVTGYRLDDRGVIVPIGTIILISLRRPNRFWGPPNLLYSRYLGSLPGGEAAYA